MHKKILFATIIIFAFLLAPAYNQPVNATSAGDLIKIDGLDTIWLIKDDGKKHVIYYSSSEAAYWNTVMASHGYSASDASIVAMSEAQSYQLGANVTIKPGSSYKLKRPGTEEYYVVTEEDTIFQINKYSYSSFATIDVPVAYFTNYTIASSFNGCVDEDQGKNYFTIGDIRDTNGSAQDHCDGNMLTEYYCNGNTKTSETRTCANGCSTGACAEESSETEVPEFIITDIDIDPDTRLIKVTVKNIGASTETYEARWIYAYDLANNDKFMGRIMTLGADQEKTATLEDHVYLNRDTSQVIYRENGQYQIKATMGEASLTKNITVNWNQNSENALPDLVIKNIKFNKTYSQWENAITADLCNEGGEFTVQSIGLDVSVKIGDVNLGGFGGFGGEKFTASQCRNIFSLIKESHGIKNGYNTVTIEADPYNDIEESNEGNNITSQSINISHNYPETTTTEERPDLYLYNLGLTPLPYKDTPFTGEFHGTVKNIGKVGTKNADGIRITGILQNKDGSERDWVQNDSTTRINNLEAGQETTVTLYLNNVILDNEYNKLMMFADNKNLSDNGEIEESNESNNYGKFILTPYDKKTDSQIVAINNNANRLYNDNLDEILSELKQLRDTVKEQETRIKYLEKLTSDTQALTQKIANALNNFITYGVDDNTEKLGAGERAAVIYSYKSAFNKLPETEEELADAIRIANGRWPNTTNDEAEKKAKEQFQKIYKRIADMDDSRDNAAVTVMAYGLRQKAENRNLESEKQGIKTFQNIYGYHPTTTEDWNIMQSITYSGATRGIDTDGDLLTDDRENELGTDPNNKDSDGDGYIDGIEVANGYNPLKK